MTKYQMISELEILKKKVECEMDDILMKNKIRLTNGLDFQTGKLGKLNSAFNEYTDIIKGLKAEESNRFDYEFSYGIGEELMCIITFNKPTKMLNVD